VRFDTEVVLARPGPLVEQFRAAATTTVARLDRHGPERSMQRVMSAVGLASAGSSFVDTATRRRVGTHEPDLTVVNGATEPTIALLRALDPSGPVVTIAHELSTGWFGNIDAGARSELLERTSQFLAVSECVARFLVDELGVSDSAVHVVHPPVDVDPREPDVVGSIGATILGSGATDWRKAPELWLRVAAGVRTRSRRDDLRFVWVGGEARGSRAFWPLEHEMTHLGLGTHVDFVGDIDDPAPLVRSATLFVSTAREDAYPLACAEAIAAGVPVLGFDDGGVGEMVAESGCGVTVPYAREDLLATAAVELLDDAPRRAEMAERGRRFGLETLATASVAASVARWLMDAA